MTLIQTYLCFSIVFISDSAFEYNQISEDTPTKLPGSQKSDESC